MKEIIRHYYGKLGLVTVTRYYELNDTLYRVAHTNEAIGTYWTRDKVEAIKHAQFLAGKY